MPFLSTDIVTAVYDVRVVIKCCCRCQQGRVRDSWKKRRQNHSWWDRSEFF